jgi:hypothetical protein
MSLNVRFSNTTADKYCLVCGTAPTTDTWFKDGQSGAASVGCGGPKYLAAGSTIRCYAYAGSASNAIHESAGDMVTGFSAVRLPRV